MTPATLIALLATPSLWTCINLDPPTICHAETCLTQAPHDLLLSERTGDQVSITPLQGPVASVARNLVVLRVVDAELLARDRAAQGMRERARVLAGG